MVDNPYTRPAHPISSSSLRSSSSVFHSHSSSSQSNPQSQSQSVQHPPVGRKQRRPGEKSTLRRNQACLSCRKRKLRCDAVRPTCGTCVRSHNYALLHDKNEQFSSVVPSCTYEVEPSANADIEPIPSDSAFPSDLTSTSALALTGIVPADGHWINRVDSPESSIPISQGIKSHSLDNSDKLLMNEYQAKADGYDDRAPSPTLEIELTQSASSGRVDVLPDVFPSPPSPLLLLSSSSLFKPSRWNITQPSSSGVTFNTLQSDGSSNNPLFIEESSLAYPLPSVTATYQRPIDPDQPIDIREQIAVKLKREFSGKEPTKTFPKHLWTSSAADIPLRLETQERPDEAETGSITGNSSSEVPNDHVYNRQTTSLLEDEEVEKANQALMDLIYPGWPPHLPNPMMLEYIVESFFRYLVSVAGLFNKGRFMARLTLPPSHHDFPHPAVLHAICAVTSRFLGIVSSTPPADTAFSGRRVEKPWPRNLLNPVDPKPIWDGLGSKRPGVHGGFFGRDGDFGQVHFSWSKLYIHDSKNFASEWIDCIQALVILSHYCYQEARWIEVWSMIGEAAQMASPLGLKTRPGSTLPTNIGKGPVSFLLHPKDEIEMIERQNLFACLFGLDTLAASTSGWTPAIDLNNVTSWIPTALANVDPPYQSSCQDFQSADLFSYHPAETTAYSLLVKSTILIRRVNDYVRSASERDIDDPTGTVEFKKLDQWTTNFRSSFPLDFRDPFKSPNICDDGRSVDEILLNAHTNSLLAIIQLHEPYSDPTLSTHLSNIRIQEAIQYLLMTVHQLNATSVDFSTFHPCIGFAWFIAARSLAHLISTSNHSSEVYWISLRNSISVMRSASARIGIRLPVGLRHSWIIDRLVADSEKARESLRANALLSDEQ